MRCVTDHALSLYPQLIMRNDQLRTSGNLCRVKAQAQRMAQVCRQCGYSVRLTLYLRSHSDVMQLYDCNDFRQNIADNRMGNADNFLKAADFIFCMGSRQYESTENCPDARTLT